MNSLRGFSRRRRLQKMLETELPLAHLGAHDRGSPERSAEARDELLRVWRALMKVSTKKRVVYILHALEGQSGEEIAAALEIPVATVWTRLHHARKELLGRLE